MSAGEGIWGWDVSLEIECGACFSASHLGIVFPFSLDDIHTIFNASGPLANCQSAAGPALCIWAWLELIENAHWPSTRHGD